MRTRGKIKLSGLRNTIRSSVNEMHGQDSTHDEVMREIDDITGSGRMFGFDWGNYGYMQLAYDPGKDVLYGGGETNSGVTRDFEVEYDHSLTLGQNVSGLYGKIAGEIGYPGEQEEDDLPESRRREMIGRITEAVTRRLCGRIAPGRR